ncbi:hypothetical protein [Aestuariirhabdus litorea]|uniref:DUF4345 domain-containing protein n=1 Tax=Aestuariirhabdus litorea TaxID=2528527 RepID=A0A3P3VM47_9GAMM|nr:hypothetical protein [Aestuariirhabdus litorea]RRJ83841.1 hypothetical protein D0544_01610 [Aestuariirhabdus litorea]RWW97064.1 hypothetical protein DZC74_01610 [Endozoicomonadaceae bacterium GTF-13]
MRLLRSIGLLYLLSGLWCAFAPEQAAAFLGYGSLSASGRAEFFTVYGGLQCGLGVAMIGCSAIARCLPGALLMSALFSSLLALFRLFSLFSLGGLSSELLMLLLLEVTIALLFIAGSRRAMSA